MQAAQAALTAVVGVLDKTGTQVSAAAKVRNDAVSAANQQFKQTVEQARINLKAALGTNTTNTTK